MENTIELTDCVVDFETINASDFDQGIKIKVYSDADDLLIYNKRKEEMEGTIFGIFIECGNEKEKTIMLNVSIDELELFAYSVLKHIKIIRKGYCEQIKIQTEMGSVI
jgi:hypothetical protein